MVRLTPDLQRLELRQLDQPPVYKIDKFYRLESLEGVFISNYTRLKLKKLNLLHELHVESVQPPKSQNVKSRERKRPDANMMSPVLEASSLRSRSP